MGLTTTHFRSKGKLNPSKDRARKMSSGTWLAHIQYNIIQKRVIFLNNLRAVLSEKALQ